MPEATECVPRNEHAKLTFHVLSLKTGNPKQYGEWTGAGWIIDGKPYTPAEATQAGYRYAGPDWSKSQ